MCCLLAVFAIAGCGKPAAPHHDPVADKAAIEGVLRQWPHDFNDRNLPAVCGLFADDVVLIYPDIPDRDRAEFCAQMQKLFIDPAKRATYAEPEIKEVLVDDDLASVRLVWTLTVADAAGKVLATVREDGVDVFRRQPDGSWKIYISHAFPQE